MTSSGSLPLGSSGSAPWKEHILDELPVAESDINDALTCILHTILFIRAPGPVRPSEATCQAFPSITYSFCAVGDVARKVDHAVRRFEEKSSHCHSNSSSSLADPLTSLDGGAYGTGYGYGYGYGPTKSAASDKSCGCMVVSFFERKVKKALFGLMSNEEKIYFEKWVVPVNVSSPAPHEKETFTTETETALQNCLLHIISAVQTIEHIPTAMYDFEITRYESLAAFQSESMAASSAIQLNGSYRLST